jgi:hypothetical protein
MAPSTRLNQDALSRMLDAQLDMISRRQALAAGLTKHALAHRLRPGGPWRGLLPGVYLAANGAPTTLQQEMAALLYAGDGSVITGPAALRCHYIRTELTEIVDVLVPAARQRRDTQFVRLNRTTRMPGRIWEAGPVRYVMPARAVADTVRGMTSLRDVRAVVADAVQRRRCAIPDLLTELDAGPNAGSMLFREALADVADGIRSVAEGDLRDLLASSGLPMPLFNPSLYDEHGNFVARPDAWWPELGIAVEGAGEVGGGFAGMAHLARGSREDAGPGPADGQVPDRRAPLHPQADTHSAGRGQKRHQGRPRRRPRSPANKAKDDPSE